MNNPITTLAALEQRLPGIAVTLVEQLTGAIRLLEQRLETHPADVGIGVTLTFGGDGRPFKLTLALNEPWVEPDDEP